jgi:hypothetical protein
VRATAVCIPKFSDHHCHAIHTFPSGCLGQPSSEKTMTLRLSQGTWSFQRSSKARRGLGHGRSPLPGSWNEVNVCRLSEHHGILLFLTGNRATQGPSSGITLICEPSRAPPFSLPRPPLLLNRYFPLLNIQAPPLQFGIPFLSVFWHSAPIERLYHDERLQS